MILKTEPLLECLLLSTVNLSLNLMDLELSKNSVITLYVQCIIYIDALLIYSQQGMFIIS